jgi:hypothetical protein
VDVYKIKAVSMVKEVKHFFKKGKEVLKDFVTIGQFRWIIGSTAGIFLMMLASLAGYVVANDAKNEDRVQSVREEMKDADRELEARVCRTQEKQNDKLEKLLILVTKTATKLNVKLND